MRLSIISSFLLMITCLSSYGQQEKRLALVIGNSNYHKGELKNPVNDARLIASTLDSLDFDVILKENLQTKRDMTAAIREFGSKRSEYDVAFVYYAGHGIQVDDENFLLPTKEVFEEEYDVLDYGISVQNIMRYLRTQTDEVNILILDACRDNPFESNWNTTRSLKGKGLAKIPPPTGSLIAFSTDSGQTAPDGDGENSVYTISLAKNMLLPDTSIDQVFRNVRAEVLAQTDGIQRPVEATQLTGQTFYLNPEQIEPALDLAEKYIFEYSDKYFEALKILEPIIDNDSLNFRARNLRQEVYYFLNYLDEALDEINFLVKNDSKNPEHYIDRSYVYRELNENEKARADLDYAILIDSLSANSYYELALFKYNELDDSSSILELNKTLEIEPDKLEALQLRAWEFGSTRDRDSLILAINDLKKIIELDSEKEFIEKEDYLRPITDFYYFIDKPEIALKTLENHLKVLNTKNIESNSSRAAAHFYKSNIYKRTNDYDNAFIEINNAIKYDSLDPSIHASKSFIQIKISEERQEIEFYNEALKSINKSIEIVEENSFIECRGIDIIGLDGRMNSVNYCDLNFLLYSRSELHRKMGSYEKSISDLIRVENNDPEKQFAKEYYLYNNLAIAYENLGNLEKSKEYIDKEVLISPQESLGYLNLADLYIQEGEYDLALENYNIALKIDPNNPNIFNNKAILFLDYLNDNENAFKNYSKAIEVSENKIGFYYNRAIAYVQTKKHKEALDDFLMVEALDENLLFSENNDLFTEIGKIYTELGDYQNALKYFNLEIDLYPEYVLPLQLKAELFAYYLKENVLAEKIYLEAIEIDSDDNNTLLSYINFLYNINKYENAIQLSEKSELKDGKDPQPNYIKALIHIKNSRLLQGIRELDRCVEKIKKYATDGYYIQSIDGKRLDLSEIFILRHNLFLKFGEIDLACNDLSSGKEWSESENQLKLIINLEKETCN